MCKRKQARGRGDGACILRRERRKASSSVVSLISLFWLREQT
jgi:hypothetical protein